MEGVMELRRGRKGSSWRETDSSWWGRMKDMSKRKRNGTGMLLLNRDGVQRLRNERGREKIIPGHPRYASSFLLSLSSFLRLCPATEYSWRFSCSHGKGKATWKEDRKRSEEKGGQTETREYSGRRKEEVGIDGGNRVVLERGGKLYEI